MSSIGVALVGGGLFAKMEHMVRLISQLRQPELTTAAWNHEMRYSEPQSCILKDFEVGQNYGGTEHQRRCRYVLIRLWRR